MNEVVL